MAVGIRIKLAGITQEQFDHAHDHINPDRTLPKGLLFHASGAIDGGWGLAPAAPTILRRVRPRVGGSHGPAAASRTVQKQPGHSGHGASRAPSSKLQGLVTHEVTCGMHKCFCPEELGRRGYFAPRTGQLNDWEATSEYHPNPQARRWARDRRRRSPCSPPLQQARLLHRQWAVHRERPCESQKSSRRGRWE
jgi:hypothetical protein